MVEAVRVLVRASAALAAGDRVALLAALRQAQARVDGLAIEEMLLQSYLFVGYPAALQALGLWRELQPEPARGPADEDAAEWSARGEAVCRTVYGGQYDRLRLNVSRLHPDLERWMVQEGYGKVLSRPGLALATRELCIVALLAVQDAPAQLYSHLRGALNAGADAGDVAEALELALAHAAPARAAAARSIWTDVRERRLARSGRPERGAG